MKYNIFYTIALAVIILASCQKEEIFSEEKIEPQEETVEQPVKKYRLSIMAQKDSDDETKALDLVNNGGTQNLLATWKQGDKVQLFFNQKEEDKLYYYEHKSTLTATPLSNPSKTRLVTDNFFDPTANAWTQSYADTTYTLDLYYPQANFDYTGQKGLLKGEGSVEEKYDYAFARVRITGEDNDYDLEEVIIQTENASFQNQQSIYRFGFKDGGNQDAPVDFGEFTISSSKGKLVVNTTPVESRNVEVDVSHAMNDLAWTSTYGNLTVIPESAPEDHFYYVSIRNEHVSSTVSESDIYTFEGYRYSDGALYTGTKNIPTSVLDRQGRFISAKNVRVDKVTVPEKTSGTVGEIW